MWSMMTLLSRFKTKKHLPQVGSQKRSTQDLQVTILISMQLPMQMKSSLATTITMLMRMLGMLLSSALLLKSKDQDRLTRASCSTVEDLTWAILLVQTATSSALHSSIRAIYGHKTIKSVVCVVSRQSYSHTTTRDRVKVANKNQRTL